MMWDMALKAHATLHLISLQKKLSLNRIHPKKYNLFYKKNRKDLITSSTINPRRNEHRWNPNSEPIKVKIIWLGNWDAIGARDPTGRG